LADALPPGGLNQPGHCPIFPSPPLTIEECISRHESYTKDSTLDQCFLKSIFFPSRSFSRMNSACFLFSPASTLLTPHCVYFARRFCDLFILPSGIDLGDGITFGYSRGFSLGKSCGVREDASSSSFSGAALLGGDRWSANDTTTASSPHAERLRLASPSPVALPLRRYIARSPLMVPFLFFYRLPGAIPTVFFLDIASQRLSLPLFDLRAFPSRKQTLSLPCVEVSFFSAPGTWPSFLFLKVLLFFFPSYPSLRCTETL